MPVSSGRCLDVRLTPVGYGQYQLVPAPSSVCTHSAPGCSAFSNGLSRHQRCDSPFRAGLGHAGSMKLPGLQPQQFLIMRHVVQSARCILVTVIADAVHICGGTCVLAVDASGMPCLLKLPKELQKKTKCKVVRTLVLLCFHLLPSLLCYASLMFSKQCRFNLPPVTMENAGMRALSCNSCYLRVTCNW